MKNVLIALVGIISLLFIINISSPLSSVVPVVNAQSCTTPSQVQNVLVTFPSCDTSGVCNFTQGSCTWAATTGATSYQVNVTEVETGASIVNTQVTSSVTSEVFNVNQSNTYKCDVSAINSCGTSGPSGSYSLLCKVDAAVTVTVTPAPIQPPAPTSPPKLPPTGSNDSIYFTLGSAILIIGGIALFVF